MPTYDFECSKCGKETEVFLHFDEPQPQKCECGGKLKKVFHAVGIVFKGSGFYCTDQKGGNGSKKTVCAEKAAKNGAEVKSACETCETCEKAPEKVKEAAAT